MSATTTKLTNTNTNAITNNNNNPSLPLDASDELDTPSLGINVGDRTLADVPRRAFAFLKTALARASRPVAR